jgi:hypothetical protein
MNMASIRSCPRRQRFFYCLLVWLGTSPGLFAVGFDRDDFLVAGYGAGNIGVYDRDFSFKGTFGSISFPTGLDFDGLGNLVAASAYFNVNVYDNDGTQIRTFRTRDFGKADIKVGDNGFYYVRSGGFFSPPGLGEISPDGVLLRTLALGNYDGGVAILPGGAIWAGGSDDLNIFLNVFDIASGNQTGSISLGDGLAAGSMFYSALTNTVLIATYEPHADFERRGPFTVLELNTLGNVVRTFTVSQRSGSAGVTRGPNGDVFATDFDENTVYQWKADGTFVRAINLPAANYGPAGIVWAGNVVPEPSSALLLFIALLTRISRTRTGRM